MLSLSKPCLSSLWCFNDVIWRVLWLFVTMVIEVMLHGLRRWILFLNIRQIYPLFCVSVYMKEFQISNRLWDVSAINTAQDDMPNCGNSLISSSCNPAELSFQLLPRILLFLGFFSAIIKDLITFSLSKLKLDLTIVYHKLMFEWTYLTGKLR